MHYGKIEYFDVANGPGVRVSLFVSGCRNHCPGCFNPETWDFTYGKKYNAIITANDILKALEPDYISGLTILGGDPMEPENIDDITNLIYIVKAVYPNKSIWVYTGYLFEDLKYLEFINYVDVLVDGPFIQGLADPSLVFRGSSNQRIIDVKKSRELGYVVEVEL